jgi:hypothetical protein
MDPLAEARQALLQEEAFLGIIHTDMNFFVAKKFRIRHF